MGENFDIIVVGSGASGAVLASRLTEDPALQVLLLEAGADLPPTGATDAMKAVNPLTLWGDSTYTFADAQARRTADQAARFYPVGRGLGGGSAMNGMGAIRPSRQDFESWKAEYGCEGWEWKDVLPCLCRLESDPLACSPQHSSSSFPSSSSVPPSSDDSCHGSNGPIPIYRQPVETWGPVAAAMRSAALSMGYTEATDLNHPDATGLCNFPYNVRASASQPPPLEGEAANASSKKNDAELRHDVLQRVSVVEGYLHAEVRARPNLTIRCDALVDRVVFGRTEASSSGGCAEQQPQRALGVMVVDVSSVAKKIPPAFVAARCEVVLCAGALHTPAILQRSGLGSFDRVLAPAGIEHRVVDLPAVGENLQDHPVINGRIPLEVAPHPESRHTTALLRFSSSGIGGSEEGDDSSERSDGSADDRFNDLYFVAVEHGTDPRAQSMASPSQTSSEGEAIDDSVTEAVGDSSSDAALPHHSSTHQAVGFIDAMLMRVRSRGRVAVASRDPRACPATIDENMLSDPEDTLRMAYAVERLATLLSHDHVQHLLPKPSEGQQQQQERSGRRIIIGQPGSEALTVEEARQQASTAVASWQQSSSVSSTPSESAPLQASTTPSGVAEVKTGDATTANPAAALAAAANFSAWMRRNASDGIHMSGTCRMGPPEASSTHVVCDSRTLMVRGVLGLRVADASIMPTNVRANTHLTCLAIGERAAELIRPDYALSVDGKVVQGGLFVQLLGSCPRPVFDTIGGWIHREWPSESSAYGRSGAAAVADEFWESTYRPQSAPPQTQGADTGEASKAINVTLPVTLVARRARDGQVVGTVSLVKEDMVGRDEELGPWLAALFVPPEARGSGAGTLLVNAAAALARRMAKQQAPAGGGPVGSPVLRQLHLWFPTSKPHLREFYEANGWITTEPKAKYESSSFGGDVTIMRLSDL